MNIIAPNITPFRYYSAAAICGLFSLSPVMVYVITHQVMPREISTPVILFFYTLLSILVGKIYVEIGLYIESECIDNKIQKKYPDEEVYNNGLSGYPLGSHIYHWHKYLLRSTDSSERKKIADEVIASTVERMIFLITLMISTPVFTAMVLILFLRTMDITLILITIDLLLIGMLILFQRINQLAESLSLVRYILKLGPEGLDAIYDI
jgi:hypothetical protein